MVTFTGFTIYKDGQINFMQEILMRKQFPSGTRK